MADSLLQLLRLLDGNNNIDPVEARPRHSPNDVVAPRQINGTIPQDQPLASFSNTGTQNMKGLINNTGYTKGNGNGSIIFGGF